MNTKKLIFGIFACAVLITAGCTTDNDDLYEDGVRKENVRIKNHLEAVRKENVRINNDTESVKKKNVRINNDTESVKKKNVRITNK